MFEKVNKEELRFQLYNLAETLDTPRDAVSLTRIADGTMSPYIYLDEIIAKYPNIGNATLPFEGKKKYIITINSRLNSNKNRLKQLKQWVERDPNPEYAEIYQEELDILETYTYKMLLDILKNKDKLNAEGEKALKERQERVAKNKAKKEKK